MESLHFVSQEEGTAADVDKSIIIKTDAQQIKCDGDDPCHMCQSRDKVCEYPDSNDNAAASRRYIAFFVV